MRNSTPVLTANVYTRLELHDLRGAVNQLGRNESHADYAGAVGQ